MMTEFVGEIESAPTWFKRTVDHGDTHLFDHHVRGVAAIPAKIQREGKQSDSFSMMVQVHEWARRMPKMSAQGGCRKLGLLHRRRRLKRQAVETRKLVDIVQILDIACEALDARVKNSRNATYCRVRAATDDGWRRLRKEPVRW